MKKYLNLFKKYLLKTTFELGNILGINKKGVSVICYHSISNNSNRYSVSPEEFKKQIEKTRKRYKFISLQEFEDFLLGKKNINSGVLLTFDDGYEDIKKILPFLIKNKIPAVLFVLSNPQKLNREEIDNDFKLLSLEEIKKIKHLGIEIGCHSATHADFNLLSKSQLEKEIIYAKKDLERKLGFKLNYFAYPKGYFTKKIIQSVKKAGFKGAFAVKSGNVTLSTNRYIIPRVVIDKSHSLSDIPGAFSKSWFYLRDFTDRFKLYERAYKI